MKISYDTLKLNHDLRKCYNRLVIEVLDKTTGEVVGEISEPELFAKRKTDQLIDVKMKGEEAQTFTDSSGYTQVYYAPMGSASSYAQSATSAVQAQIIQQQQASLQQQAMQNYYKIRPMYGITGI